MPPTPTSPSESILVDDVADWLMSRALDESTVEIIFEGCCERLVAADIPVTRGFIAFRTLHPLFRAVSMVWEQGRPLDVEEHPHGEVSAAFRSGPHFHIVNAGIPMLRRRLEGDDVALDYPVLKDLKADGATDYVAWAVRFGPTGTDFLTRDGLIGSWTTNRPGGFSDGDLRTLRRIQRRLSVACKVTIKNQIARNVLVAYLGGHAGERVYAGEIARGSGETIHAVIWFADLRDSTRLSGEMPLDRFLALLNAFFECIAGPVLEHDGEVLRFIGDAMLAIFPVERRGAVGDPGPDAQRLACDTALRAAREAIARVAGLNATRAGDGEPPLRFGIGLHVGNVMYGNIGVPSRVEFSVVGVAANHAAKIESLCKVLNVPLVVSADFAAMLPEPWVSLGRHVVPGLAGAQAVSTVPELVPESHDAPVE